MNYDGSGCERKKETNEKKAPKNNANIYKQ